MTVTGNWDLTMNSPMGEQKSLLVVSADGATMTSPAGGQDPVLDFARDGDTLKWKVAITAPIPMKLHFDVTVAGDTLEGKYRPGMFPPSAVRGVRSA